jgi:hypothetical protein
MNSAWASLQGLESQSSATAACNAASAAFPLSLFMWLGSGSEGQAGLLSPIAGFGIFAAQDDEGELDPRQMLPDPLSRRD